jgi:long-chain acyl-CoA synthetase
VCVVGDRRPYLVALVVPDAEAAAGRDGAAVRAEIDVAVAAGNSRLSRVEQVKRHVVLDTCWVAGGDELTPTMKVRRKIVAAKYAATIEALYAA